MEDLKLLVRVMTCLFLINILGCSQGWSVGGIQITPQDTVTNTAFVEIISHDSTQHWYADKIYNGDNWCHLHDEWEYVEVK
tara:strand:- start:152 stop:394 length:243 start_codon:yes stop_codon:yes gene_type:complete